MRVTHTAMDIRAGYISQLSICGVETFVTTGTECLNELIHDSLYVGTAKFTHLTLWAFGSDQGGDEKACIESFMAELEDKPFELGLVAWCHEHVGHLMYERHLKRHASVWSACAKMCNTWRSPGCARLIYDMWVKEFGLERALAVCRKLPPRALRGRWGAAYELFKFIMFASELELNVCFRILVFRTKKRKARPADGEAALGELSAESWTERKGRWSSEAFTKIEDGSYWVELSLCVVVGAPLHILSNWNKKHDVDPNHMTLFVCAKYKEIQDLYEGLLQDPNCWDTFTMSIEHLAPDVQYDWVAMAVGDVLSLHSDYQMRFTKQVTTFPRKLLWLVWSNPFEERVERI